MTLLVNWYKTMQDRFPKNKYACFSIWLLGFWLIISVYFYFEHYRVEKVMPLNKDVKVGNLVIKIQELYLINYKEKQSFFDLKLPWYYGFSGKLSESLRIHFIQFCNFYSFSRIELNSDLGTIYLRGYVVSPERLTLDRLQEQFDIYVADRYESCYIGGSAMNESSHNSIVKFEVEGRNVPLAVNKLYIIIRDRQSNLEEKIPITPKWENRTYTFFNRKPSFWV